MVAAPDVAGAANVGTPAAPDASGLAQNAAHGTLTVDTAANAAGAGEAVGKVEDTRGTAASVGATVQDPGAAATSAADSRASSAVSEHTPPDPTASTRANVDVATGVANNPEAAAANQAESAVGDASANVRIEGSVGTPPKK